jgi:hypothetical protein
MNFVIQVVVSEHVDLMPSEDGQLTEMCKGDKYLQIESHWTVLTIILQFSSLIKSPSVLLPGINTLVTECLI